MLLGQVPKQQTRIYDIADSGIVASDGDFDLFNRGQEERVQELDDEAIFCNTF